LEQLPANTDLALILNPKLNAMELLASICDELEIVVRGKKNSVKSSVDHLNRYLLAAHARGRVTALLIDEAQNLSMDTLEQLRLLTNLETGKQKLLKIILLGQPELRQLLENEEVAQINQRITSRYHLLPLASEDVAAYVGHRLAVAGVRKRLFSDAAVRRVAELSRGVPRLINLVCDRALLGAYVEEKDQVDLRIINQAAREVLGRPVNGTGLRSMLHGVSVISVNRLVLGLLLLVLGLLAVSLYYGHWEFVFRTDQGNGVGLQEWKQVPADKDESAQKKNSGPVSQKVSTKNEHGPAGQAREKK